MTVSGVERTRDSIAGSLSGLLVGDALGCPVEGWSPEEIAARYGRLTAMVERRSEWTPERSLVEIEAPWTALRRGGGRP